MTLEGYLDLDQVADLLATVVDGGDGQEIIFHKDAATGKWTVYTTYALINSDDMHVYGTGMGDTAGAALAAAARNARNELRDKLGTLQHLHDKLEGFS